MTAAVGMRSRSSSGRDRRGEKACSSDVAALLIEN